MKAVRALCLVLPLAAACGSGEDAPLVPAAVDWSADERLAPLMAPCYEKGHFDRDTSDMLPVLIEKLRGAPLDVLRNVREELAASGEPALLELERLVRSSYADPHGSHDLVNALGVIQLSEAGGIPAMRQLLKDCLGHPQETVRNATVEALTRHAGPEHFDDLLAVLAVSRGLSRQDVVSALFVADRHRLEEELLRWIEEERELGLQRAAARLVAGGADATTAERFAPWIAQTQDRAVRAFLVATQEHAPGGGEGALALLEEMLAEEDPQVRSEALAALEFTSRTDWIAEVARADPVTSVRLSAISLLGPRLEEEAARAALQVGLDDSSEAGREASLRFLLEVGDVGAGDLALSLLDGGAAELATAMRALAGNWQVRPELAERALTILSRRLEERAQLPPRENRALLQAVAQVPGPESTTLLLELRDGLPRGGESEADRRWLALQASNTADAGRELLRDRWRAATEVDDRFDLLWAASFEHDEATREFLLEVLEAEGSAPHERLYAAERLAREGPASRVAPRIKRARLRMSDPAFRPAMECLLWRWYG